MENELPEVSLEMGPVTAQPATPMSMLAAAVAGGADIVKMEKLMELAERWEEREAKKAFTAAMAEFKANPPEIFKDKRVGFTSKRTGGDTSYKHATIGNVVERLVEGLARCGISHRWNLHQGGGLITVTCILTHRLGHSEETKMEGPRDDSGQKNALQAVASTISYLQRYTLLSATGLATKDQPDSDGRSEGAGNGRQDNPAWQELAPTAWRDLETPNGANFGELADLPDGDKALAKLFAMHRSSPALAAWAAGWIARTMKKLNMEWPSGLELSGLSGLPENFEELNAGGVWTVFCAVRTAQYNQAKAELK